MISGVGYLAAPPESAHEHVLISIRDPSLVNARNRDFLQVAITLANAVELRKQLDEFLASTDSGLPSMLPIFLDHFFPDVDESSERQ